MGKNKKKECVLDAVLDEETYMAYKSGQAIDNNGLRSPKGSYWPTVGRSRLCPPTSCLA